MTQHEWKLGKYTVGRRIGGGMTSVHLAINNSTHQQVVLKLIAEADADASDKIHAEERGAEIQKRLAEKDTRIPKIYEWGRLEGYFYIEMEYVNGKALDRTGKIGSGLAVTIAIDVCEVLELAHREDIIHGDIKPGNILDVSSSDSEKTQRTTIKVLDFGVARFTTSATRNIFRSVPYCSPEVRQGADYTRMDDLWSLCATIYELVESRLPPSDPGRPLFTRESRSPADLQFVLQKMFSPDIRNRYQTASQLKADLLAFQSGKALAQQAPPVMQAAPAPPAPASTRKSKIPRIPVFAVLILVVIGLIALALAISADTMMDFARAADAAQPESQASIMQAAQSYKNLDRYGGVPRMLAAMSRAPGKLRKASLAFAERTITKYARELDLPEKGNVSEREWKAAMDVLAVARDIDDSPEVEAMLAYAKGHYHRINAESRIGMSAPADRKKNERALGLDHYTQAETYFNEALDLKPEWSDAQFGLVRLYASVFPEMDKAEGAMMVAERWEANPPLRLQFEMAWGHHARAAELSRTVMDSLKALSKEPPGPVADLNLSSARSDLDQMDNHIRRALSYFDACLSRGACWDARFRRTKVGALMVTSDAQRSLLGEMELRLRIPPSQELP